MYNKTKNSSIERNSGGWMLDILFLRSYVWRPIKIFSKREDLKYLEKGNETIIFYVLPFDYFR